MSCLECVHIFQQKGLQTSVESGEWVEYRPLATLDDGPIEFLVKGGAEYLDLAHSYLLLKVKVVRGNGGNLRQEDDIGPVNLLLHSLFSEVDLFLNGVQITSPSGCYAYQAYLQTLLSYSSAVKKTQLAMALFDMDQHDHFNSLDPGENPAMGRRKARVAKSQPVELLGRLHADLFHQSKYLLSHLDLRVKLTRSKDSFVLMSAPLPAGADGQAQRRSNGLVELLDAAFYVRKVKIAPAIALAHAKTLERANAVYPITKTLMRVFSAAGGSYGFREDNLFVDKLPQKLVVGFVRAEAFNGSMALNPYHFEHLGVNFLTLYHQGQQIPAKGLTPDFEHRQYARAYLSLFEVTDTAWQDMSHGITYEDYAGGSALFCFDLTPSLAQSPGATEIPKSGPIRLEVQFAAALEYPVNVIVYGEFDSRLEVTRAREVLTL